jgi:hypothetical protein
MPIYSYLNLKTNETSDIEMSMAEMDEFEKNTPHMQRVYDHMHLVDPVGIGVSKPPSDFSKYVLGKVAKVAGAQNSQLEKRWARPREW